ncbi:MAG TPA: universal stress protein [Steroidobacteraceae bacterium]|nr:universal stress protein [Steroidobacteraceae bacterium]
MNRIRRILVPIKHIRAKALPAVAKAAQIAKALGARVQLFHAMADPLYVDSAELAEGLEESRRQECLAQLEKFASSLRRRRIEVTTAAEWDFPAYEAILRNAHSFGADLIVLDAHPAAHRAPWLLRFTDWELLRLSAIPVLLVKNPAVYQRPTLLASIDPTHAFAKPTHLDREILKYGSLMADSLRGALHVLHAYDPMPSSMVPVQFTVAKAFPEIQAQVARRAHAALERALGSAAIPAKRRHLVGRHPIDAIEEVAGEIGSSIVVMGAISRSGLKRLVIGNTAEKVLDELSCDVLIVKPRAFRSRIGRSMRGSRIVPVAVGPVPM